MTEQPIAEKDARRASVLADVLSDHRPMPLPHGGGDLVECSCRGVVWELPDWRQHVGRAQVLALDEDAEHGRAHGCVTSPGADGGASGA